MQENSQLAVTVDSGATDRSLHSLEERYTRNLAQVEGHIGCYRIKLDKAGNAMSWRGEAVSWGLESHSFDAQTSVKGTATSTFQSCRFAPSRT